MKLLPLLSSLVLSALAVPVQAASMTEPTPAPAATASPAKVRATPFHGIVSNVDDQSTTFTFTTKQGEIRTYIVDKSTVIMNGAVAGTFADIKSGVAARGSALKTDEPGKYKVGKVTVGEKETTPKARKSKKAAASPKP